MRTGSFALGRRCHPSGYQQIDGIRLRLLFLSLTLFSTGGIVAAEAERLYWHPTNSSTEAAGEGRCPVWSTNVAAWNSAEDGSGSQVAWKPGASAVFAGSGTSTVVVDGAVSVAGIEASGVSLDLAGVGRLSSAQEGLSISTAKEIVLSTGLQASSPVAMAGGGTLTLAAPCSFPAGLRIDGGMLRILSTGSLGTGTVTVSGDTAIVPGSAGLALGCGISVDSGARLTIQVQGSEASVSGPLSGAGELIKAGTGTLTLTGPLTLSGQITLKEGEINISGASPSSPRITVAGGLLRVAKGTLSSGSSITLRGGGALCASGAYDSPEAWVNSGMIVRDSDGILALPEGTEIRDRLDLGMICGKYPKLSLGACGHAVIAGQIVPGGGTLRLGGGGGILEIRSPITGGTALQVGKPGATGTVMLQATNSFTGGLALLGGILMPGNAGAIPPGEISLGSPGSSEFTCMLDLNNLSLTNPVSLAGRGCIRNSGGGQSLLGGDVKAGANYLRLSCANGSTLTLTGTISSSSIVIASSDMGSKPPAPHEPSPVNLVVLAPHGTNACARLQVERNAILRAADGKGLPPEARLVISGGVYEGSGTMTRELVADSKSADGKGGVTMLWDHYSGGGFSAHGGDLTLRLGGIPLVWGAQADGKCVPGNYKLVLNAPTADSRLVLDMPLDLAGIQLDRKRKKTPVHRVEVGASVAVVAQPILDSGMTHAGTVTVAPADTPVAGAMATGNTNGKTGTNGVGVPEKPLLAGIEKLGGGTLVLAASNCYAGPTRLEGGTLLLDTPAAIAGGERSVEPAAGTVVAAAYPVDNAFLKLIASPNATPFTVALAQDSDRPLDFGSQDGAILRAATLGSLGAFTYSGILTPCDGIVRLGGGGGTLTLEGTTPAPTVVGGTGSPGGVNLPAWTRLPASFVLASGRLSIGGKPWSPPAGVPANAKSVHAETQAPVLKVSAMDRWIDAAWTCPSDPEGGFLVETSADGRNFRKAAEAWPGERFLPLFVGENPPVGTIFVRVSPIDGRGKPGPVSNIASVKPAKRIDVERTIVKRYPDTGDRRKYSAEDPANTVTYSDTEKEAQRTAASEMFVRLKAAAENTGGPRHFTIPPGVYRTDVNRMILKGIEDFTIHAPDTEFIVDAQTQGAVFSFVQCRRVTLTGRSDPASSAARVTHPWITMDSERLPMSVGRILAVHPVGEAPSLDVEILPGYETDIPDKERMMAYRPDGSLANVCQMGWDGVSHLGKRVLRIGTIGNSSDIIQRDVLRPGNLLVLHTSDDKNTRGGAFYSASGCADMTYESVRILDGGGAPSDHGTAGYTVYRDWRNIPRAGTSRLEIAAGLGQFSKDGGSFLFEDCEWGPHLDDGINLLSTMNVAARQDAADSVVICGPRGPRAGSVLTFRDYRNWEKLGEATVTAVTELKEPETSAAVNDFSRSYGNVQNGSHCWRVTLDRAVSLPTPFPMVISSDRRADSIVVRGCLFRDQLAQIMLIQGAKSGLIENNLCLRSTGPAVSMQFAQYWWEGPMPGNITVRNNVIRDNTVWAPVIGADWSGCISAFAGTTLPVKERLLSGFRIEGNTIINPAVQGVLLHNVAHAVIAHNTIVNPGSKSFSSENPELAGITLANCSDVLVHDNEVLFGNPRCTNAVRIAPSCDKTSVIAERNTDTKAP